MLIRTSDHEAGAIDHRPVCFARISVLVTHPAYVWSRVGENHRVRLTLANDVDEARPIISLPLAIRTLSVCAIEPDLEDFAVMSQNLAQHALECFVVLGRAVGRMVTIPRREIDPEF